MEEGWVAVESVSGMLQAEILRGLLESMGVPVRLSHEAAGTALGLGVGPLAQVDLLVPASRQEEAERILEDYHAGRLEQDP